MTTAESRGQGPMPEVRRLPSSLTISSTVRYL